MSRTRRTVVIIVALLGFFATACGSGNGSSAPAESAATVLVDEFETLEGTTIDLASLQGEDVVLWFWAPW
ncbi:MAG: hypothetical protein AAGC53_17080 [Actinomycetota bacterium]